MREGIADAASCICALGGVTRPITLLPWPPDVDLARVVGRVVCTVKDEALRGTTLLLVVPIGPDGRDAGDALVAIDAVGAGAGETVFYVTGREASFAFLPRAVPADASIVGIVDSVARQKADAGAVS